MKKPQEQVSRSSVRLCGADNLWVLIQVLSITRIPRYGYSRLRVIPFLFWQTRREAGRHIQVNVNLFVLDSAGTHFECTKLIPLKAVIKSVDLTVKRSPSPQLIAFLNIAAGSLFRDLSIISGHFCGEVLRFACAAVLRAFRPSSIINIALGLRLLLRVDRMHAVQRAVTQTDWCSSGLTFVAPQSPSHSSFEPNGVQRFLWRTSSMWLQSAGLGCPIYEPKNYSGTKQDCCTFNFG